MTVSDPETDALALGVYFVEPQSTGDVERLRQIRNDSRRFMTGNTKVISPVQQQAWWAQTERSPQHRRVWLVKGKLNGTVVGYVMVTFWHETGDGERLSGLAPNEPQSSERNRANVTVALVEHWRGRGIGTEMYRFAARQSKCRTRAIIRMDNPSSIKAAEKAGYRPATFARGDNTVVPDVVYYEIG